jgi:hypothetical protein
MAGDARETAIDHDADAFNGDGTFSDVGGEDDFAAIAGGDGAVLLFRRLVAVERQEQEARALGCGHARGLRASDFGCAGQEDEDVAARFPGEGTLNGGGYLLFKWRGGVRGVLDFKGILASLGAQDAGAAEVRGDGGGIERGRHDDEAEVGAVGALEAAEEGECEVSFEMALVELIEDDGGGALEARVAKEAAGEDTFGEKAQARGGAGDIFEADLVAHGGSDGLAAFGGDEAGGEAGGQAAGFEDEHLAAIESQQGGRDAGCLTGSGRSFDDQVGIMAKVLDDVREQAIDGQVHVFLWWHMAVH